ncbi:hypothetical protein Poli38472_011502 [Pythium oligandrum]|uniref:Uncharacterized protein n=1 Tax=Pythium oligandrum TaxID=41045 RepID=A0A8K1FM92_PYTOL|nr:hypothetical protein Poli38472_011502 [Pythium oligandrum]|eukprot:TMW64622.1 hypothetical protein Poli38472_011502 [Pythium oligandrum]
MGDVALNHTQLVLKNYARISQTEVYDKYRNYVGSDRVKYDLAIVKLEPYVERATIRTVTLPFGGIPNPETMKQEPGDAIITVDPKTLAVWVTDIAYGDNALCGLPFSNSSQSQAASVCATSVTQGNEPRSTDGMWSFLVRKRENTNRGILGFKSPGTRPHDSFHAYSWIFATVSKWITPVFVGVNAVKYNPSS